MGPKFLSGWACENIFLNTPFVNSFTILSIEGDTKPFILKTTLARKYMVFEMWNLNETIYLPT